MQDVNYSHSDTVAALQAITIYILHRVFQDDEDIELKKSRDDVPMIHSMAVR